LQVRPGFLSTGAPKSVTVGLVHLVSYEHMGRASVRCVAGCECADQIIDAHQKLDETTERRASVYLVHDMNVTMQSFCSLEVRVLKRSSSGEHKFRIARVIARVS